MANELQTICREAAKDYPSVTAERLFRFLTEAGDPDWNTPEAARHIARRMHKGLINWRPEQ